jgi:hypothetical protein
MNNRYQHDHSYYRRLAILAGLVCLWTLPAKANIVVQTKGLQKGVTPGTSVHGQIVIANGLSGDAEQVRLKIVEFVPTKYLWEAVDPNDPNDHPWQARESKSQSCVKWTKLTQAEVAVGSMDSVAIPVDISIPGDANGLYRCGVVVHVPPNSPVGVAVCYDVVVPILLEVAKSTHPALTGAEPKDFAVVFYPRPIKVTQDTTSGDPYHNYAGVNRTTITTTSPLRLSLSAKATSDAGGSWSAIVDPASLSGTAEILLGTKGSGVNIDKLVGGAHDVSVALVTLQAMPDLAKSPFLWRDRDLLPPLPDPSARGN